MKTVKFYTLGCKVNQYETQSIRERFSRAGFSESENGSPADIYLINTCTVTHKADSDSRYYIHKAESQNPRAKIIVTGCLVEKDALSLAKIKGIDYLISKRFFSEGISSFSGHTRAFLKIQDGCDNFCSYCKVPLVRGHSRSKKLAQIIKEAKALVKNGFKEIVLCGICLGAFGRDLKPKLKLVNVIKRLEKIAGLFRIRLSSIEAGDVSDELIRHMLNSKKLCRHLHIPIQSGDDQILKRMNRRYSSADYLGLIRKIKKQIPDIAITSDVLVGFPGESEESFNNTLNLVKKIMPLRAHIFPYSPRQGTSAASLVGISPQIVKKRMQRLRNLAEKLSLQYRKKFLNKKARVLIEGLFKEKAGFWEGHTDNYIKILVSSEENLKNRLVIVRLKRIFKDSILADLC